MWAVGLMVDFASLWRQKFSHETIFYRALGVKVGIAPSQYGVGFESVFDIGSQRLDWDT